jgi:DNA-binding NtrC family response regulator
LNVFPITLPPLRERESDIIPLAEHFVQHTTKTLGLPQAPGLSANVRKQLLAYSYPGNVRELKNIIERSVLLSDFETITHIEFGEQIPEDTPSVELKAASPAPDQPTYEPAQADLEDASMGLKDVVSQYERTVIIDCLNACNWHTKKAAEQLALPMSTLNHKMKKYDISAAG